MSFTIQDQQDFQDTPVTPDVQDTQVLQWSSEDGYSLFNVPIYDAVDFQELIMRFCINLLFSFIFIRLVYYKFNERNKELLFTFFLFNIIIFFVCALMRNLNISMGFAFGLFALFGLLRYRTEPVPIKDMTYLFIVICLGMINAMFSRRISYAEFITANILIISLAYIIERVLARNKEFWKRIAYEKIDLIKPENRQQLMDDLKARTGLDIHRIHIERINFLRDTARIIIYYREKKN